MLLCPRAAGNRFEPDAAAGFLACYPIFTSANEQGATIGVAQSAAVSRASWARCSQARFIHTIPALPYLICGGISALAGLLQWLICRRARQPLRPVPPSAVP